MNLVSGPKARAAYFVFFIGFSGIRIDTQTLAYIICIFTGAKKRKKTWLVWRSKL
jgi:hypothetical protein